MTIPQHPNHRQKTIVIAGASGVIGSAAVEQFARLPSWNVIALSRRRPLVAEDCKFTHVSVDLSDTVACKRIVAELPAVKHLIYAAAEEASGLAAGWRDNELILRNGRMFSNLLGPLATSGNLRHVSLLQGAKAYGAHVHAVTVPLREESPRDTHANFYWLQEDAVRAASTRAGFRFTIWRPQVLLGSAPGAAMNPVAAIGAYAAICRERGLPFVLPGTGEALWELVDADLLAEAFVWSATAPAAADQIFNITNGDVFVLRHAWPELAKRLGLDSRGDALSDFTSFLTEPASRQAWSAIAARHGLLEPSLDRLLGQSHVYLDLLNSTRIASKSTPALLSTIKLRQAGFAVCRDSFASLTNQLSRMSELRLLPDWPTPAL